MHYGETLYRDGDYYGREVNQAARVAARAAGGEVLVTRPVVEAARPAPGVRADRRGPAEGLRRRRPSCSSPAPPTRTEVTTPARSRGSARATGLLPPARPCVVLLSGGRDSTCLLDVAVAAGRRRRRARAARRLRAAARRPTPTRRTAARCARGWSRRWRRARRRRPRGRRATSRPGPATSATARRAARGGARRRARRRRAHGDRPGRDRALPAGGLARARRALLGMAAARRAGSCGRCWACTREETAAYCARARPGAGARTRRNDDDALRPRPRA